MARLFIAVETDAPLRAALMRLAAAAQLRGVRRVPENQLHLTLRFLGDVDDKATGPLAAALAHATERHRPFALEVTGGGAFGPRRSPTVVWGGVADSPSLRALADDVDAVLATLGFALRDRPLVPHITLARGRHGCAVDTAALERFGHVGTLRVEELVLFESVQTPAGSVHTPRTHAPLLAPC